VYLGALGRLESLASAQDAVGNGGLIAGGDRESAHRASAITDAQLPLLVTELEAHVQVTGPGCIVAP